MAVLIAVGDLEEIFDEIENYVFENHPLGKNILGSPESVKAIQRENILDFLIF